ncbi:hypothetical protein [Cellulomonas triticagri]|uniref:Uncharacterized protein n=1 Tax=Cellulomonas triticagri TaxID=2483352 RepID=A0A3M2JLH8_9CELL|nr:hypothetical protein [Cellulomonas triticagri]RMI13994.1 hypothetical protein EBM89_01920 [Cellulomonas triticagri]
MPTTPRPEPSPQERADRLKERVYVTFAALAVVLTLRSHGEVSAGVAATTLAITVGGTLLAVLLADVVAHLAVHASLPSPAEARHMVAVCTGALGVLVLPMIFLGVAGGGGWTVDAALQASTIALVVSLGVVARIAVRRLPIPKAQRLLVLVTVVALGFAVVALELLAHG